MNLHSWCLDDSLLYTNTVKKYNQWHHLTEEGDPLGKGPPAHGNCNAPWQLLLTSGSLVLPLRLTCHESGHLLSSFSWPLAPLLASALACFLGWCDEEASLSSDISETVVWKRCRVPDKAKGKTVFYDFFNSDIGFSMRACLRISVFLKGKSQSTSKDTIFLELKREKTIQMANRAQAGSGNRKCWLCWMKQLATVFMTRWVKTPRGTNREPG